MKDSRPEKNPIRVQVLSQEKFQSTTVKSATHSIIKYVEMLKTETFQSQTFGRECQLGPDQPKVDGENDGVAADAGVTDPHGSQVQTLHWRKLALLLLSWYYLFEA